MDPIEHETERSATLIAGAGSNDTRASAAALGELAGWPEIRAALVAVPYYTRPGPDGVVAHFTGLAATSPVPLVVYHIPYRTGQALDARTLLRLAEVPRIAGIKLAAGGIDEETVTLMAHAPESFALLAGDDAFASPLLALGAAGAILASAHLRTADFAELVAAWRAGHATTARALGHRLSPLSTALFAEPNPTVIKVALHAQGRIPTAAVRLPLLPASPETTAAALRAVQQLPCLTGS